MDKTMRGVFLPGDSTAEVREYPVPTPGDGEVLLKIGASGICGSDIGYIYHEYKTHKGLNGLPAYKGVIAGHEPSGMVVATGPGCRRFTEGDRVLVYHIVGCKQCVNCRKGYFISCTDPDRRQAYGWQRDGGHAEYLVADESTCIPLPAELSFEDGALIACGFGTAYEGLIRSGLKGPQTLLVVGLGPVGMAAGIIGRRFGAGRIIGLEGNPDRIDYVSGLGIFDDVLPAGEAASDRVLDLTGGAGCDVTVDASGSLLGRASAIDLVAEWGNVSLLGEGGELHTEVSDALLHKQISIHASWVTSLAGMEYLTESLAASSVHPDLTVSHRFSLEEADRAYAQAAGGAVGKVVLVPSE